MNQEIVDKFHIEYETNRMWEKMSWMGTPMWKLPFDAFVIQELIYNIKPDFIIETGTNFGGSTLFYASILELLKHGKVITIDKERKAIPKQNRLWKRRVTSFVSDSIDSQLFVKIKRKTRHKINLVLLDSWHTKEHVLQELKLYSQLVSVNSYIVVEDTHVNGHPIEWKWGEGPYEAVKEFLKDNSSFQIDRNCEKFRLTYNPSGYLKRIV